MARKTAWLGGPVAYEDFGGDGPPIVLVHGLGGAAINWMAVAPELANAGYSVVAPDLRGFGHTPLEGGTASVPDNQRLLDSFLRHLGDEPAIVIGNSMGGLISVMQAAAHPDTVRALLLVDPALPWPGRREFDPAIWTLFALLLVPGLAEAGLTAAARRRGAERLVEDTLRIVCADPSRVPAELVRAHVQLAETASSGHRNRALPQAGRSLLRLMGRPQRFDPVYRAVAAPVRIIQGELDRLVPARFSIGLAERYGWQVDLIAGAGHVPMIEVPGEFLRIARRWLAATAPPG